MKLKKLAVVSLLALSTCAVMANATNNNQGTPYVGAAVSMGGLDTPSFQGTITYENATLTDLKDDQYQQGLGYRIYGGYLMGINKQLSLGAEVGYANPTNNTYKTPAAGNTKSTTVTYGATYFDVLATAHINLHRKFAIVGKAGFASVTQKIEVGSVGPVISQETAPELALGFAYKLNQNVSINLNADQVMTNGMSEADFLNPEDFATITTYNLGVSYAF